MYDVKSWTKCSSRGLVTSTLHLVVSTCHLVVSTRRIVVSTCHPVVSTCLLVTSTCRPVVSSSQLVVLTRHLLASACRFVVLSFQLVVSSCQLVISSCQIIVSSSVVHSTRRLVVSTRTSRHFKYREDPVTEKADCASSSAHMRFWRFSCKMDELNAVKDILRDALSRIDQIPPQNSQNQNTSQSNQDHELPPSSNNTNVGLLARAQSNFR